MKKVLVFLANGFEEIEALSPVDYLRRAGCEVVTAATGTSNRTVVGGRGVSVVADMTLDGYLSGMTELPDAVVVPGGVNGSKNISECQAALTVIDEMNEKGRIVAAICAAPAVVLVKTTVLAGRKWTCYPGYEEEVPESIRATHVQERVVESENLVTSAGAGSAEEFAMKLVYILCGEEVYNKVKSGTIQR